ncbi:MAG: chemotaxis protein CheW [Anaerolineae bacterium]|jgi:purine-binding chemotaxis protein CheW|nr:chemotaxis protein CheW [Anaerolineae bacterium]
MAAALPYLKIRVGQQWYGLPVALITAVVPLPHLADLPGAADEVLGLLTLREQVMPVLDAGQRFGLGPTRLTLAHLLVALRHEQQQMALLVDEVDEVVQVSPADLHPGGESPLVTGSVPQADGLLLLLAADSLFQPGAALPPPA